MLVVQAMINLKDTSKLPYAYVRALHSEDGFDEATVPDHGRLKRTIGRFDPAEFGASEEEKLEYLAGLAATHTALTAHHNISRAHIHPCAHRH